MGTHTPKELLVLWTKEELSFERVTGHSLQNIVNLEAKQTKTHAKTNGLEHTVQNMANDQEKILNRMKDLQAIVGKLLILAESEWQSETAQTELKKLKRELLNLNGLPVKTTKKRITTSK